MSTSLPGGPVDISQQLHHVLEILVSSFFIVYCVLILLACLKVIVPICDMGLFLSVQSDMPGISVVELLLKIYPADLLGTMKTFKDTLEVYMCTI